jgi:prepilin signal peptidase PulO-like enzyme (type II secretory pathway)
MTLQALKGFPLHVISILNGLLTVLLTKPEGVLFTIVGILGGFTFHSAWAGALLAFTLYTVFYVITQYVSLWSRKIDQVATIRDRDHG